MRLKRISALSHHTNTTMIVFVGVAAASRIHTHTQAHRRSVRRAHNHVRNAAPSTFCVSFSRAIQRSVFFFCRAACDLLQFFYLIPIFSSSLLSILFYSVGVERPLLVCFAAETLLILIAANSIIIIICSFDMPISLFLSLFQTHAHSHTALMHIPPLGLAATRQHTRTCTTYGKIKTNEKRTKKTLFH